MDSWYKITTEDRPRGRRISLTHKRKSKIFPLDELNLKLQYVRYTKFINAFFDKSFELALDLAFLSANDAFAQALVAFARQKELAVELIKRVLNREVDRVAHKGVVETNTLLRSNEIATIMLTEFCRMYGMGYLCKSLQSQVANVCKNHDNLEVDPLKLSNPNDLDKNYQLLSKSTKAFLSGILNSLDNFPEEFRVVWQYLHRKVHHYFPEIALKVVGGSLFLRFFCPAILSPHWFGLVEEPPSPEAQRHLTLVTKTIQNIANGMRFGKKEAYMEPMNVLVDEQIDNVNNFFKAIIAKKPTEQTWDLSAVAMDISCEKNLSAEHMDCIVIQTSKHLSALSESLGGPAERVQILTEETESKIIPLIKIREEQIKSNVLTQVAELSSQPLSSDGKEKEKESKGSWVFPLVKKRARPGSK